MRPNVHLHLKVGEGVERKETVLGKRNQMSRKRGEIKDTPTEE